MTKEWQGPTSANVLKHKSLNEGNSLINISLGHDLYTLLWAVHLECL